MINFNHYKCKKESSSSITTTFPNESLRLLIENELKKYMKEYYETYNFAVNK